MRELSLLPGALPIHTGHMANDVTPTAFVTGASGFLGSELVRVLVARGYQVFAVWREVGAEPITLTVSELDLFLDGRALVGRVALTPPALTHLSLVPDRPR